MRRTILPVLLPLLLLCAALHAAPSPAAGADTPVACTADDTSCDRCGPGRTCCKLSGACLADDLSDCPTSGGCFANGSCQLDDLCVVGSARPEPPPSPCSDTAPPACASCADGQYCCEADGRCVDPSQENGCAFTACFGAAGCDGTKMCEKGAVAPTPTPAPTPTSAPSGTPGGPTATTPTPAPSGGTPTPGPTSSGGPTPAPGQCRTLELVNDTSEPIWIGGKGGAVVPSCITAQTSCLADVARVSGDLTTCGCSDTDGRSGTVSCPTGSTAARNASNALICKCDASGASCGGADDETTCATTGDGNVCFWTLPEPATHGKSANKYLLLQGEKATFCLPQPADIAGKVAPVWWSGGVFARTGCADDGTRCATADCGATPNGPCPPQNGGLKPLTLAEFTLQSNDKDFYDVTIIDGVNVAVEMKPIPPTQPTVPPGADADYWCQGAGSTAASGRLDACSWDFKPVVPDPASPGSGTDRTALLLYNGAQCGTEETPTGCVGPSGSDPKESGKSYCTAPRGGSCLYPCSSDADCATHWGGAMKCKETAFSDAETLKFCQCDDTADCAGSKQGSYCGTQFFPGIKTQYMQVCGPKLRGWWTANDFCADPSTKYGPLDCSAQLPNGQSGSTTLSQLFGCTGANAASCYNQGTTSNDCCGCATSPASPFFSDWPAAASLACANGHNNPTWNRAAQPWLVFLKKGCPTAYTYAYDDSTSTFTCKSAGALNEAGYTVTFGAIAAPALADCAAAPIAGGADALATTAAGASGCTAFLSRAVGYRASLAGGTRAPATTITVSDWIQSATFAVGRPQELLLREVSPDDVVWLSYPIATRPRGQQPQRLGVVASDELGTHTLDTRSATALFVPTGSGAVSGATPELPLAGLFDAYSCYRVTPSAGAARPRLVDATYTDASGTHTVSVRDVPDSLCIEADLGDGLGQTQTAVACYALRSTGGATTAVPRDGGVRLPVRAGDASRASDELTANNRFGTATIVRSEQARQLCVPVEIRDRGRLAP